MTIRELIEISKYIVLTEEDKEIIIKRLEEFDEKCYKESSITPPTPDFMNRLYTL